MTSFLFIRHGDADHGRHTLAGRSPGVHLSEAGRAQVEALAQRMAGSPPDAVYASPLERCLETAAPIAAAAGLELRPHAAFQEVDFGEWTGRTIASLEGDERWRQWNELRGTAVPPGGESMLAVLERGLAGVRELAASHAGGTVVVVSHCDVIRPLFAHFLGMPLDHLLRFDVDPGSVSAVAVQPWGPRVLFINRSDPLPLPDSPG